MEYIFYDTCALLSDQKEIFKKDEKLYLSSITLNELENIKTSGTKDEETKYNARILLHALAENKNKYEIVLFQENFLKEIKKFNLPDTNDTKIISCALHLFKKFKNETCIFYTKDLACEALAAAVGLNVIYKKDVIDKYSGYAEFTLNDETLAQFYEKYLPNNDISFFEPKLFENEYLLIKNCVNEIIDKYKWHHNELVKIPFYKAESKMFGKIVPKDGDPYQQIALDSLYTNQITMLRGAAGSGKSYLALGYMFSLLEKGEIDKIIIFCNTVAVKGSAKLGFYPGSRTEKLLDSQIGNLLESKLGDQLAVEKLINEGSLILLPMADIRGYDTTGMNAAVYITEAQNLDIELMRLALQRIGEDSICILDGDDQAQVDSSLYAGNNNGLRRVSKVFRGSDIYGEVKLKNIHRSKIANLAQKL